MIEFIALFFYGIVFGFITAFAAKSRGRDWSIWWMVGFLLGIFGLMLVLVMPKEAKTIEAELLNSGEMRKCPHCAEAVKSEATICRYCNRELPSVPDAKTRREQQASNLTTEEKKPHFMRAVRLGDTSAVLAYLGSDLNLANVADSEGKTPLHWAATEGRTEIVELLLSHGANAAACDCLGKTALFRATANGNEKIIQLLQSVKTPEPSPDTHGELANNQAVVAVSDNLSNSEENKSRARLWVGLSVSLALVAIVIYITLAVTGDFNSKSITQLRVGAFFGNPDAQYQLGIRYETGGGVEKDITKFVDNLNKAAEQGNSKAQIDLGAAYFNGKNVPKDIGRAIDLWVKAAAQGNANLCAYLGAIYFNGEGVPQDIPKAIDYLTRAAKLNEPQAQSILGHFYYYGNNVSQDTEKGLDLLKKSAEQGNEEAMQTLKQIASNANDVEQLPADVIHFVGQRDGCDHFRGEEPYDEERRKFLSEKMHELCDGTDNQLAKLKGKYSTLPDVIAKLNSYDTEIEASSERTVDGEISSKIAPDETKTLPSTEDITMYKYPGFPTLGECVAYIGDKGWREHHGIPNGVITFEDAKKWAKKHTVVGLSELLSVKETDTHISFTFDELLPELRSVTTYYKDMRTCKLERNRAK